MDDVFSIIYIGTVHIWLLWIDQNRPRNNSNINFNIIPLKTYEYAKTKNDEYAETVAIKYVELGKWRTQTTSIFKKMFHSCKYIAYSVCSEWTVQTMARLMCNLNYAICFVHTSLSICSHHQNARNFVNSVASEVKWCDRKFDSAPWNRVRISKLHRSKGGNFVVRKHIAVHE